jgi:hypothetical protein
MPYLDFTATPVRVEFATHPQLQNQLTLALKNSERAVLIDQLADLFLNEGLELRLSLPGNWVLFWKRRDDGSRTLVAHPQSGEWVGTVALAADFAEKFILSLKSQAEGQSLKLSSLGQLGAVSNLELIILFDR